MQTTLFGQSATFGVEFAKSASRPYIHVRLWISGSWVGDIEDSLMPEQMCAKLVRLGIPVKYPKFACLSDADCPTYEELVDRGGGSFGESFDPFVLNYYSVIATKQIHFLWKLHEVLLPTLS